MDQELKNQYLLTSGGSWLVSREISYMTPSQISRL